MAAKKTTADDAKDQTAEDTGKEQAPPLRVAVVPPEPEEGGFTAGEALTPGQRAGLEPIDQEADEKEAENRAERTNMQTAHEAENALDPVSGGPTPAVTSDAPLTARQVGAPITDESGRPPLPADLKVQASLFRDKLVEAKRNDEDDDEVKDQDKGWRTPLQMGIPGGVAHRLFQTFADRVEVGEMPGGSFFPETGKRYRLK